MSDIITDIALLADSRQARLEYEETLTRYLAAKREYPWLAIRCAGTWLGRFRAFLAQAAREGSRIPAVVQTKGKRTARPCAGCGFLFWLLLFQPSRSTVFGWPCRGLGVSVAFSFLLLRCSLAGLLAVDQSNINCFRYTHTRFRYLACFHAMHFHAEIQQLLNFTEQRHQFATIWMSTVQSVNV